MDWLEIGLGLLNSRRMYRIIIGIVLVAMTVTVRSQSVDLPPMTADRPGFATSPFIVYPKHFQIETGSAYERASGNHTIQELILFNTFLTRYGINKILEARFQADFAQAKTDSTSRTGLNLITVGLKLLIYKGKGIIPKTSAMVNLTMPFTQEKVLKKNGQMPLPSTYLLMQNDITEKFDINYTFGFEFIETYMHTSGFGLINIVSQRYSAPIEFAAISLEYGITEHLTTFIESYNWFATGELPKNFIDVGCAYLITKNIQLDLSGSMSLNDLKNYYMINGGVTWRITRISERQ